MRAIIVGGGIAGPVAAMALQQAGIEADVFEARPRPRTDVGSYFTVSPNGLDALAAVSALGIAQEVGFATRLNHMRSCDGKLLGTIPVGRPLEDGTPALTMKRSHLARRLAEEAERRGIRIRHEHALDAVRPRPGGGVVATFTNGTVFEGDLLVGADGIHSPTRRTIDPAAPEGRYVGLTNFGGITPPDAVAIEDAPESWHFVFGRRAFFGYHRVPDGSVVWFVNEPRAPITADERRTTSGDAWKAHLASLVADDATPARALIERGELEFRADNTYDLPHVPIWHRDRMIVIGDAAHAPSPSSGQGASLALEDAVLLARSLRDATSIESGFAGFESLRRERVESIVAHGARSSSSKLPGAFGRVVRDAMLKLVFRYAVTEKSVAFMYDHRIDWDANRART